MGETRHQISTSCLPTIHSGVYRYAIGWSVSIIEPTVLDVHKLRTLLGEQSFVQWSACHPVERSLAQETRSRCPSYTELSERLE